MSYVNGNGFLQVPTLLTLASTSNSKVSNLQTVKSENLPQITNPTKYSESLTEPEHIDIAELNEKLISNHNSSNESFTNDIGKCDVNQRISNNSTKSMFESNDEQEFHKSMEYNRDLFSTQLYTQIACKQRCVNAYDESTKDFIVDVQKGKASNSLVKVAEIERDGNCLFVAISHQLYGMKIKSPEHNQMTNELRKAVVDHILANVDLFYHDLKDRVLEYRNEQLCKHKFSDGHVHRFRH